MKTTSANTPFRPKTFLISIILYIILLTGAIIVFTVSWQHFIADTDSTESWFLRLLPLFLPGFIILLLVVGLIGSITGYLRGQRRIAKEHHEVQLTNPYKYYKELPNDFGIGVASLLTNSTLENEKDIVAAILDLCAKKYLHLSKHSDHYVIRLEPTRSQPALKNENYLLDLIRQDHIRNIDYRKWYDYCVEDGIDLGLYKPTHLKNPLPKISNRTVVLLFALMFILSLIVAALFAKNNADSFYVIFGATFIVTETIAIAITMTKRSSQSSYKSTLERQLTKTPQGVTELQKLYAFRNFLAQFHTFVDKDPEAVVLWDRYLSYAQVFGLADELMKSGYHQLIDNSAFRIDDIDHISLSNLSNPNTSTV